MPDLTTEVTALAEQLVEAMRAAAVAPQPLLLAQPAAWKFLGVSRAAWFRLRAAGELPDPVSVPGAGPLFRRSDLERFATKLRPGRRKSNAA